jgi:hypothetical protein
MSVDTRLREVFADFARLGERPDLGLSVPLGREDRKPELASLQDGERVVLTDWSNLYAEGTVRSVLSDGFRMWYGILGSVADPRDIDPQNPAAKAPGEQVTSTTP